MYDTFFLHVASVVSQVCLFLYSLTMLHTFPNDITWVTESTYFAMSFCTSPFFSLPFPQTLIRSIFSNFLSFDVAEWKWSSLTYLHQEAMQTYGETMCCSSRCTECLWEGWVSWFLLWVYVRQTTRLLWSYK